MFTITQAFLNAFPNWVNEGWQANDQLDLASFLINLQSTEAKGYINLHPPHKPGGNG